jgi:O-antigen/teichoic acid export membrane protein
VFESSAPSLTEIYVRGEESLFRKRFREILGLSGFLAIICALVIVCANSKIVSIWTAGKITWEPVADLLLALLLVFTTATRCMIGLFGVIAKLQPVRLVYFLEACVFIAIAIPASQRFGTAGILSASLLAHAAVTAILSVRAAIPYAEGDGGFLRMVLVSAGILIAVFLAGPAWMATPKITTSSFLVAAASLVIGAAVAWWLLLTAETRMRILAKLSGLPIFLAK